MSKLLLCLSLLCVGCAPTLANVHSAVTAAADFYATTDKALSERYESSQQACFRYESTADCLAKVRADWEPIKTAAHAFYDAVLAAQAAEQVAISAIALGHGGKLMPVILAAMRAIAAGEKLTAAILKLSSGNVATSVK